jgi:hypothetical protein
VASSKSKIYGFLAMALAIAILYFCPPEICVPFRPTCLSNPLPENFSSFSLPEFYPSFFSYSSSPKIKFKALAC